LLYVQCWPVYCILGSRDTGLAAAALFYRARLFVLCPGWKIFSSMQGSAIGKFKPIDHASLLADVVHRHLIAVVDNLSVEVMNHILNVDSDLLKFMTYMTLSH